MQVRYFRIDHEDETVPGYVRISGSDAEIEKALTALKVVHIGVAIVEITREEARKLQAKRRREEAKEYDG